MKVDVIIPTYNRGSAVLELLKQLLKQGFNKFGVIVVNDGSIDDTQVYINQFKDQFEHCFVHFSVLEIPNCGRSGARNAGVAESNADLLIFFDDDVRPCDEAVSLHVNLHHAFDTAVLYGPCRYDKCLIKQNSFQDYRRMVEDEWYADMLTGGPIAVSLFGINGGNFSVRRNLLLSVGGFDQRLQDAEDFKLAYDLVSQKGVKVFLDMNAWVYHDDFRPFPQYVKRRRETRIAAKWMISLCPEIKNLYAQKYQFSPPPNRKVLYRFFSLPLFTSPFFSRVLDVLPVKLKFKAYDFLITANCIYIDK